MADGTLQFHTVESQKPVVGKSWASMGAEHRRAVNDWLSAFATPPEILSHQHTETSFVADGDMPYLRIVDAFVYRA